MKRAAVHVAALGVLLSLQSEARGVIGTLDVVPAATILVPYFAVDPDPSGPNATIFLHNTASGFALAQVTVWSDHGIPVLSFPLYLTGYDVEVIDLHTLLVEGAFPMTAHTIADPEDLISPKGAISQDINFTSCHAYLPAAPLDQAAIDAVGAALSGQPSSIFGGLCGGADLGDGHLRGYVTIDAVIQCTDGPTSTDYFDPGSGIASVNQLTARYEQTDPANNFAYADNAVHIEASTVDPLVTTAGNPTFYGRMIGWTAQDQREPLGAHYRARYADGGIFGGGGWAQVFREPPGVVAPFACESPPGAEPARQVLVFDEQEDVVSGAADAVLFPRVTQSLRVTTALPPIADFGAIDVDLRAPSDATGGPSSDPTFRGSYLVMSLHTAGRFSVSIPSAQLPIGGGAP